MRPLWRHVATLLGLGVALGCLLGRLWGPWGPFLGTFGALGLTWDTFSGFVRPQMQTHHNGKVPRFKARCLDTCLTSKWPNKLHFSGIKILSLYAEGLCFPDVNGVWLECTFSLPNVKH